MQLRCLFSLQKILILSLSLFTMNFAVARDVAPYFFTWAYNSSSYHARSLMQAKEQGGVKSLTLAFAITNGSCGFDGSVARMIPDIKNFVASGGRVIISFGGAAGTYIETACTTDNKLFNAIDSLIQSTGVTNLDFDVEGSQLQLTAPQARRTRVLARLQAKYPQMYLSYTLPVDSHTGLQRASRNIISQSIAAGIEIDIINLMTMDYYYEVPGKSMGDLAIMSAEVTHTQLRQLYSTSEKSDQELYSMIGITPMIGTNDDFFTFHLADAQKVVDYAVQKDIGFISYWGLQRDRVGTVNYYNYSQQNEFNYQYYKIFEKFLTAKKPVPTPLPTPKFQIKKASFSSAKITSGQNLTANVNLSSSVNVQNSIVQLNLYNSAGQKVANQDLTGQSFSKAKEKPITWANLNTKGLAPGTYSLSIGIFSSDWSKNYLWASDLATVLVLEPPPLPPASYTIYSEGLLEKFSDSSWNANINYDQADSSKRGRVIGVRQYRWGGLSLLSGTWSSLNALKAQDYKNLKFMIYSRTSLNLSVSLSGTDGKVLPAKTVRIPAYTWTEVKISMSDLNSQRKDFNRINFMEVSGKASVEYLVDEVSLGR